MWVDGLLSTQLSRCNISVPQKIIFKTSIRKKQTIINEILIDNQKVYTYDS